MKMKMKITQKINLTKYDQLSGGNTPYKYRINIKISDISVNNTKIFYLSLKNGYLKFNYYINNSIYKDDILWLNPNFNIYFTNKEDVVKFIYLMKCLEKNYIKDFNHIPFKNLLNSKYIFNKMFKRWKIARN